MASYQILVPMYIFALGFLKQGRFDLIVYCHIMLRKLHC